MEGGANPLCLSCVGIAYDISSIIIYSTLDMYRMKFFKFDRERQLALSERPAVWEGEHIGLTSSFLGPAEESARPNDLDGKSAAGVTSVG